MEASRQDIDRAEAKLRRLTDGADQWYDSCEVAATDFARLMVAANVDQQETLRRLEAAGVAPKWAWEILNTAETQAEESALDGATPVCPHCMAPVGQFDHFCPKCAGPVTAYASFDPMGQIYSTGRAYRLAATDKKPKGVVVLGMWLIFAPALVSILFWAVFIVDALVRSNSDRYTRVEINPPTLGPILWFLFAFGMLAVYTAILYKVTKHWLQQPDRPKSTGPAEDGESIELPIGKNA